MSERAKVMRLTMYSLFRFSIVSRLILARFDSTAYCLPKYTSWIGSTSCAFGALVSVGADVKSQWGRD